MGIMVGIFYKNSTAQLVVLIIIEGIYFSLHIIKWPYVTKQVNLFHVFVRFLRLVCVILNIPYLPSLNVTEFDKQCIAFAQVCCHMLCFVVFLIVAVKNIVVILVGSSDDLFERDVPVRMMLWPRYRKVCSHYRRGNYNQARMMTEQDDEVTTPLATDMEDGTTRFSRVAALKHLSFAKGTEVGSTAPHYVAIPQQVADGMNQSAKKIYNRQPPILPPHIEFPANSRSRSFTNNEMLLVPVAAALSSSNNNNTSSVDGIRSNGMQQDVSINTKTK